MQAIVISYYSEPFEIRWFFRKNYVFFVLVAGEKCSKLVLHDYLKTIILNLSMMTKIRHFYYVSYSRANAAILFLLLV